MATEPGNFVFINPVEGTNQATVAAVEIKMTITTVVEPVLKDRVFPDLEPLPRWPELSQGNREVLESGKIRYEFRMSLLRATLVEGLFTPGYWNYLLN